jgi:hypothetical protein
MHFRNLVGIVFGISCLCLANENGESHGGDHDGGQGHGAHHHHAAIFGGATIHDSHFYPTVGLDYEFLFAPPFGAVAVGEVVFADHTEQIYGLGLAYHPIAPLKIAAIPAYLTADGHSEFLMRGNLEYGIHAGPVTVAPSVSVDYVAEEVLFVAGLAIGAGF